MPFFPADQSAVPRSKQALIRLGEVLPSCYRWWSAPVSSIGPGRRPSSIFGRSDHTAHCIGNLAPLEISIDMASLTLVSDVPVRAISAARHDFGPYRKRPRG